MDSSLRFDDRVAIVTGAGNGLGRCHALLLGSRGCRVVVNDLGGSMHGGGASATPAEKVVAEIKALGGDAVASYDSVESGEAIVQKAIDTWGRIDILVNNAGILRDTSFQKMSEEDWDLVYRVHVNGAFRTTRAAWNLMRDQGYGRIVMTASAAGIYGNFGQANYSMAKLGLVGFANTLAQEGKRKNVLVNTIAPIAGSRLTETVLPKELIDALKPEYVSPLVAWLCHEACEETGGLFEVGGGFFAKLRWERTVGKTFPLGRNISPEAVKSAFGDITDFGKTEHPLSVTESMQPVLNNLQNKAKGGNEFIDVDAALAADIPELHTRYDERDLAFYGLAVGAGADPLDQKDLRHVYELAGDGFQPLPTFAVTPVLNAIFDMAKRGEQFPGFKFGFERILHGEQSLTLHGPLPNSAELTHKMRIKDVWDKGKNAVVVFASESRDESNNLLFENELVMVVRGAGGWGGDRGPSGETNAPPDRAPDAVIEQKIDPHQALLYRLCGDWNPLHADPQFAQAFGFPRPILHGLCTFGFAARHVIKAFCDNDSRYFKTIRARFAESVFPGETVVTEMWKESPTRIVLRARIKERDKVAITAAAVELFDKLPAAWPKAAPKPATKAETKAETKAAAPAKTEAPPAAPAAAPAAAPTEMSITSEVIFEGVKLYVEAHPELVKNVNTVYLFKLTSPDSAWIIDLKTGAGSVRAGTGNADCTLELSDTDFLGMASGALNPQKLYFGGKLKISGNVMASQKLEFLQKIDKAQMAAAMQKAGKLPGAAAPAAAPAQAAPKAEKPAEKPASSGKTEAVFKGLAARFAKEPALALELAAVVRFEVSGTSYTVDAKSTPPSVEKGANQQPDTVIKLTEEDLTALVEGQGALDLYQHGRLRVDGDVRPAKMLGILRGVC